MAINLVSLAQCFLDFFRRRPSMPEVDTICAQDCSDNVFCEAGEEIEGRRFNVCMCARGKTSLL